MPRLRVIVVRAPDAAGCRACVRASLAVAQGGLAEGAHPRAFGAFPRVIAKYVREDSVLSLEDAVHRMSSMAARRLGLHDRGIIAPGMLADLVVFDPEQIRDMAEFGAGATQYAEGVDYLFVNGTPVIDDGQLMDVMPGRVLRRGHCRWYDQVFWDCC